MLESSQFAPATFFGLLVTCDRAFIIFEAARPDNGLSSPLVWMDPLGGMQRKKKASPCSEAFQKHHDDPVDLVAKALAPQVLEQVASVPTYRRHSQPSPGSLRRRAG
jgi:hypothetical protein